VGSAQDPVEPDAGPWLDPDELSCWMAMGRMMLKLRSAMECQLERESQLSYIEYHVLAMLSEREDHTLRMSDLAIVTNASLSRLSHLIKRLEARGYVRREPRPGDRRSTNAVLTDAGYDKLVTAAPGHARAVRSLVFDKLGTQERRVVRSVSERITARVEASDWDKQVT
jgi:DNA-binding MarR family transcriptional regulator